MPVGKMDGSASTTVTVGDVGGGMAGRDGDEEGGWRWEMKRRMQVEIS